MPLAFVPKDALTDETAHAVERMASELFELRVLGDPRAFDRSAIGSPLLYRAYFNGVLVPDGFLIPRAKKTEPEVLAACKTLFEGEIAAGRRVIVWRAMPVFRAEVDFEKDEQREYVRFRCAFAMLRDLKVVKSPTHRVETVSSFRVEDGLTRETPAHAQDELA